MEICPSSVSTVILAAPVSLTNHLSPTGGRVASVKVILRNCVNIKSKVAGFTIGRNRRGVAPSRASVSRVSHVKHEGSGIFMLEERHP
jgi:hypothetical protein